MNVSDVNFGNCLYTSQGYITCHKNVYEPFTVQEKPNLPGTQMVGNILTDAIQKGYCEIYVIRNDDTNELQYALSKECNKK